MRISNLTEWAALMAKGEIYGEIKDGRYKGSIGKVVRLQNSSRWNRHTYWNEDEPDTIVKETRSYNNDYLYSPLVAVRLKNHKGRPKTLVMKAYYVEIDAGPYTPKFVDEADKGPAEIRDIFDRVVAVDSLIAFVQNNCQYVGTVKEIDYLGNATIKTLKGYETKVKVVQRNCIVIDRYIEDAALMSKLSQD